MKNDSKTLDDFRNEIDKIDQKIINLLVDRLEAIKNVSEYKKSNKMAIYQPEREVQVYNDRKRMALEANINAEYIESIFKLIIEHSKKTQEQL